MPSKTKLGDRIRELREAIGLSQDDLAGRIEVERSYISQMETGRRTPSIAVQEKLARALNTTLDDFLKASGHRLGRPSQLGNAHLVDLSDIPLEDRKSVRRVIDAVIREFRVERSHAVAEEKGRYNDTKSD